MVHISTRIQIMSRVPTHKAKKNEMTQACKQVHSLTSEYSNKPS